ncbi:MAG: metallophosphoesterase [Lachnospiraceae bacterium]|nr:metallophosphoesterase [Lachnospiraceae bacterium]
MIARILFVSDLHKRYSDSSSIKGQLKSQMAIQEDIIAAVSRFGITHIIIMGDWYDRGFHGIGQAYGAMEMDRRISAAVNGEVYLCVGNHLYLERDDNPELYIIQPNDLIRPSIDIPVPEKPIFKMVNNLQFGPVLISFFHFSKMNKNYVAHRANDIKFHIGVYHDDSCVPGYVAEMDGFTSKSSVSYMNDIYRNVDIAMHGHIHSKVGAITYELNTGRKVPMFIPGSLGITQNKESFKHQFVQLPIVEIDDNYDVIVKLAQFSTHMELLRFYATKKKKKEVITDVQDVQFTSNSVATRSLADYMTLRGYSPTQLRLIDAAGNGTLNLGTAVYIMSEVPQ